MAKMANLFFLLYLCIFLGVNTQIFGDTENSSLKVVVNGATDTYKCYVDRCYNVTSYSLYQKKTEVGCRGEGLLIDFSIKVLPSDAQLTKSHGYLANKGAENNIHDKQVFSKNCKVIRR